MEPELKEQEGVRLKVGETVCQPQTKQTVEVMAATASDQLPATTDQTNSSADSAAGTGSEQKHGQLQKASPAGEPPPFVINVVDIMALLYALGGFFAFAFFSAAEINLDIQTAASSKFFLHTFISIFNGIFSTYWLGEVVARVHKARGESGLLPALDKICSLHPILPLLYFPLVSYVAGLSGTLDLQSEPGRTIFSTGILIALLGLPIFVRWLYLIGSLSYKCSHLGPNQTNKSEAKQLGALAGLSLLAFLFAGFGIAPQIVSIVISGILFVCLRNAIIRSNPAEQFPALLNENQEKANPEIVSIKYNHFVELQKWFKQRFALRSPWKLAVLLLILIGAVACNLHVLLLNFIISSVMGAAAHIPGAIAPGNELAADRQSWNTLANSSLVFSFGMAMMAVTAFCLFLFIRAPKRLLATKDGLCLKYLNIFGKKDLDAPWHQINHIKVIRPPGKTSAASDLLVFERKMHADIVLKLAAIASANDREKLLAAIDRFAPEISREAAIEETLRKPIEHNYTELWLQALAAPPKREKLKPLITGALLNENRYLVERELGAGGQGFAYLAEDQRKGTKVVLKEFVLPVFVDINARRQSLENFEKEAKLLTKLDHRQVVKLEGFFVEDHRAYLVLEHIDGENLRQIVLRDGPMPEERIRKLGEQMCSILTYLHGLSPPLVHRDFTPDNLILNKDGTLKLIDFNVAQQVEYATTGTVVGKQAYLPPEQFRGQAEPASDLYALGATLYFLAAAKDPVPISVARPIKDGLKLSNQLDHLITELTQMEPQNRPANAAVADKLKTENKD